MPVSIIMLGDLLLSNLYISVQSSHLEMGMK